MFRAPPVARSDVELEPASQVVNGNRKRFGDSREGINRNRVLGTFNVADENRGQVSLLRQFFLTQARAPSLLTKALSQDFAMLRYGHAAVHKQEAENPSINYTLF